MADLRDRSYEQIKREFIKKNSSLDYMDLLRIHRKWTSIGKKVAKGRF